MKLGPRGKLFVISLLLLGGVGVVTLLFFESRLRAELNTRVELELRARARSAAAAVGLVGPTSDLKGFVDELAESSNATVAVVSKSGVVRAASRGAKLDSAQSNATVRSALAGKTALARRTLGHKSLIEVAAPIGGEQAPGGAVWLSVEPQGTERAARDLRSLLLLVALVGLIVAVFMSGLASELMARTLRSVVDDAVEQATGEAPMHAEDSGDDIMPTSKAPFQTIADRLHKAVGDLAEERDRLETILEQMQDAVLVLDAEGRVSLTNDAANHLLHMDDDDVGRPLGEAVDAVVIAELAAQVANASEGDNVTIEFELQKPRPRNVLANAASIRNDGGMVVVMHDVSEIRRLERVRRDFVANVSHELRTPIAVIRANAETLLDGALTDEERAPEFVEGIHRSSERLSHLIGDLLDLSRIEAGHFATDIKSVTLREAVDSVVDGLVSRGRRSVAVVNEVDDDASVLADTTGLSQILQNLLDNALKYAPEDGHVWVRATPSNDVVRIEVQDDGPGIDPHHRQRVFERFYRIDPGRSRQLGGTGLGLSIVKNLAERMGGSVGVEAAPDRGSLFWVELPRAG